MNTEFIAKSLRFHGQPLQKIWAGERGDHHLYQLGITNPDFSIYFERQKNLTFQDRAKRLKLHQFLARKAEDLFNRDLLSASVNTGSDTSSGSRQDVAEKTVTLPPYEYFLNTAAQEKPKVYHCTLDAVKPGQIVYGLVTKPYQSGMHVKVLCTREPLVRYLADIHIKAQLPHAYSITLYDDKGNPKSYGTNSFVCCEVLDISVDADRMTLGMKGVLTKDSTAPLGLITPDQIPEYYRKITDNDDSFLDYLCGSKIFNNTNCYEKLYQEVGLDINDTFSHMKSLKHRFPTQDYAIELRQTQASKWAFRSVADGIEHFKIGRHVEAFQCLNKALSIDPRNVEGLVARGALYANKGSFIKAVEDFETALKLNAFHTNARKYMGETLVALGRSYEEDNELEEAIKAYQNCLNIIPNHEQARISLDALMRRPGIAAPLIDINMLSLPGASELKKKKKSKHKSSSSSSTSDGSNSSSGSDSDDSSSDSDNEKQKKKNRRQKSLSPLSKRMGDMNSGNVVSSFEFNQPFHMLQSDEKTDLTEIDDFLKAGADDDYETRVQKLIKDASKHKKLREGKSKKKTKKKRKRRKRSAIRAAKKLREEEAAEALKKSFQKPPNQIDLKQSLQKYERSLMEFKTFQQPEVTNNEVIDLDNEEPPPAPSFKRALPPKEESPAPPAPKPPGKISIRLQNTGAAGRQQSQPKDTKLATKITSAPSFSRFNSKEATTFRPFPIKAPVVLDKFGCFRVAVHPEESTVQSNSNRSRSRSKPHVYSRTNIHCRSDSSSRSGDHSRRGSKSATRRRSKSLTRHRSKSSERHSSRRSHSRSRRSHSRSRRSHSRSKRSHSRSRRSHSRSSSRSRSSESRSRDSRSRSHRRSRSHGRRRRSRSRSRSRHRRPPSPFNPKRRPRATSSSRRRRSPDNDRRGRPNKPKVFGNRVWQRPADGNASGKPSRWDNAANNKATSNISVPPPNVAAPKTPNTGIHGQWQHDKFVKEDGISLEEIDKIITQAKKDRKEEILQRDKNILKKNPANNF